MKINKDFKIWKACANDDLRPALGYIHFKKGYAYASNSHILAKVELNALFVLEEYEMTQDGLMERIKKNLDGLCFSSASWKLLSTFKDIIITEGTERPCIQGSIGFNDIYVYGVKSGELNTPDFEGVLKTKEERVPIGKVGINASLLADLSAAIGMDDIRLDFFAADKKIFIHGNYPERYDAWGIIMPQVLTAKLPGFEDNDNL